ESRELGRRSDGHGRYPEPGSRGSLPRGDRRHEGEGAGGRKGPAPVAAAVGQYEAREGSFGIDDGGARESGEGRAVRLEIGVVARAARDAQGVQPDLGSLGGGIGRDEYERAEGGQSRRGSPRRFRHGLAQLKDREPELGIEALHLGLDLLPSRRQDGEGLALARLRGGNEEELAVEAEGRPAAHGGWHVEELGARARREGGDRIG